MAFAQVLTQDKGWFDRGENVVPRIVQVLVKDGDDARNLSAVVLGQLCVVTAMEGIGLTWTLVRGWQLTLARFAIAPAFVVTMVIQTNWVARCEVRNKWARSEVAKGYHEVVVSFVIAFLLILSYFEHSINGSPGHLSVPI